MMVIIPSEVIERKIFYIRGQKVMLDRDLAELYGVETRVLNQAVRRNIRRFPVDFMFPLSRDEIMNLSQIVTSHTIKQLRIVFDAIRELMAPPAKPRRKIGFERKERIE